MNFVEAYGVPQTIRTNNEAVFTSRLFQLGLKILGIRHQRIQMAAPWQNGRIERFFGSLKKALDCWREGSFEQLNEDLGVFRFWYNQVRPHQNLGGTHTLKFGVGVMCLRAVIGRYGIFTNGKDY